MKTTFLAILFSLSVLIARAQRTYTLGGTISDSSTREKLPNVSVWINPVGIDSASQWNTVTDANGHFSFSNLSYGDYVLHISRQGFYRDSEASFAHPG